MSVGKIVLSAKETLDVVCDSEHWHWRGIVFDCNRLLEDGVSVESVLELKGVGFGFFGE